MAIRTTSHRLRPLLLLLALAVSHTLPAWGASCAFTTEIRAALDRAAAKVGLDPRLLYALAWAESGFCPRAVSKDGAIGLLQVMPKTARELGFNPKDLWDPYVNALAGGRYLKKQYLRWGNLRLALAAYNAGPGAVEAHGGVPPYPETAGHIRKVLYAYRYYLEHLPPR